LQIPTGNAGGHLAHIGGAALGYIYAQQLQNGKDIGSGFERLWKWLAALFTAQPNMKTVHRTPRRNSKRSVQRVMTALQKKKKNYFLMPEKNKVPKSLL